MPKIKSAKNSVPNRIGKTVDLREWLNETETIKDKDGKETTRRKNVSDTIFDEIKDGKENKDKDGRVTSIVSPSFTLSVEIAKRRIPANKDGKPYEMEYASLLPNVIEACALLVGGNTDTTVTKDKDGNESEQPSVTKYFRQGYGMLARNNASAKIATEVEGPAKGIEQAIKGLMKSKGWTYEKAKAKLDALNAED
jgi:hypothetical protein